MKKKVIISLLCTTLVLSCVGCNGKKSVRPRQTKESTVEIEQSMQTNVNDLDAVESNESSVQEAESIQETTLDTQDSTTEDIEAPESAQFALEYAMNRLSTVEHDREYKTWPNDHARLTVRTGGMDDSVGFRIEYEPDKIIVKGYHGSTDMGPEESYVKGVVTEFDEKTIGKLEISKVNEQTDTETQLEVHDHDSFIDEINRKPGSRDKDNYQIDATDNELTYTEKEIDGYKVRTFVNQVKEFYGYQVIHNGYVILDIADISDQLYDSIIYNANYYDSKGNVLLDFRIYPEFAADMDVDEYIDSWATYYTYNEYGLKVSFMDPCVVVDYEYEFTDKDYTDIVDKTINAIYDTAYFTWEY